MSERKVLNKYYPPDYDPSQIPRSKERRNATFIIRVMAPCNMRCTTCGEYIYKGRKFNARKEDVDDMKHLGLRIYRFYIRCTACVSEISFRTDPANTDYVLEAGATRNFEALAKAEKLEEERVKAYENELKENPMKLLEERTESSKREMDRLDALEELYEMNKRQGTMNHDELIDRLATKRAKTEEANESVEASVRKPDDLSDERIVISRIRDEDDHDNGTSTQAKGKTVVPDLPAKSSQKEVRSKLGIRLVPKKVPSTAPTPNSSATACPAPIASVSTSNGPTTTGLSLLSSTYSDSSDDSSST